MMICGPDSSRSTRTRRNLPASCGDNPCYPRVRITRCWFRSSMRSWETWVDLLFVAGYSRLVVELIVLVFWLCRAGCLGFGSRIAMRRISFMKLLGFARK